MVRVVVVGFLLTIFFTRPLFISMNEIVFDRFDAAFNGWVYWRAYNGVVSGKFLDRDYHFNPPQYFMFEGIGSMYDHNLFNGLFIYSPFRFITSSHDVSVNLTVFTMVFLSFISCYFALGDFFKSTIPRIFGSLVYSFSPPVLLRIGAGHFEYLSRFFIPILFVLMFRVVKKPKINELLLFVLILFFQVFSNVQLFLFFFLVFVVYLLLNKPILLVKKIFNLNLKKVMIFVLITAAFSGVVYHYFSPYYSYSKKFGIRRNLIDAEGYSPKWYDFIIGDTELSGLGDLNKKIADRLSIRQRYNFNYPEKVMYIGYFPMLLVFWLVLFYSKPLSRLMKSCVFMVVFGLIYAFGPYISFLGFRFRSLYLYLFELFPILSFTRTPGRMWLVVLFPISLLIAFSYDHWLSSVKKEKIKTIISIMLFLSFLFGYSRDLGYSYKSETETPKFPNVVVGKNVVVLPYRIDDGGGYLRNMSIQGEFQIANGLTGTGIGPMYDFRDSVNHGVFSNEWKDYLCSMNIDYAIFSKEDYLSYESFNVETASLKSLNSENNDWILIKISSIDDDCND